MKKIFILLLCAFKLMGVDVNWSTPPTQISSQVVSGSDPHIAVDGSGNVIAIWLENGMVKADSKPVNMNWGATPVTLSTSSASNLSLVCDASGNATAVWLQNGIVETSSKALNGTWSIATSISSSGALNPVLAIDDAGDVIAAWVKNGNLQTSTKLFGGNWQGAAQISSHNADICSISIGGSGANTQATIVWHGLNGTVNAIYGATKLISTNNWSSPLVLSGTYQANFPKIAVDSHGNSTAVWFKYNLSGAYYSDVVVQGASLPFGGSWCNPEHISAPGIMNPANLNLHVRYDQLGNAIALWNTSFDNATFTIQSSIMPVFQKWNGPIDLVSDNIYAYQTHLSVASLGDALALFMFYNGINVRMMSSELDITGFMDASWSLPINLTQQNESASPNIASRVAGNVVNTAAIWVETNGTINSVVASTGKKTLAAPPTSLGVVQSSNNLGVFTEYFNTLTWQASTDPNVAGYLIYRNGIFLAQVGPNVLQYIDDNRIQNAADVYTIATFDNDQSHSNLVSVTL